MLDRLSHNSAIIPIAVLSPETEALSSTTKVLSLTDSIFLPKAPTTNGLRRECYKWTISHVNGCVRLLSRAVRSTDGVTAL